MVKIEPAKPNEMTLVKTLYRSAFPKEERKPFWLIRKRAKQGSMEILTVSNDNCFAGLVITVLYRNLLLVDYFAISPEARGQGIGSQALKAICDRYQGKHLFLEIEKPREDAKNQAQRLQRKRFYLHNGFTECGVDTVLFGIEMELLCYRCSIHPEDYLALYRSFLGARITKKRVAILPSAEKSESS